MAFWPATIGVSGKRLLGSGAPAGNVEVVAVRATDEVVGPLADEWSSLHAPASSNSGTSVNQVRRIRTWMVSRTPQIRGSTLRDRQPDLGPGQRGLRLGVVGIDRQLVLRRLA